MPDLWPQLPREWERYELVLKLEEVIEYSGWSRSGRPTDVSEGVAFILDHELNLYRASTDHAVYSTGSDQSYYLWIGLAGGIEGGQFTYPRVHLKPSTMRVAQAESGLCLLVSISGHVDLLEHLGDRSRDGWEKSERVLRSLHYWSRCRYLELELPPVRSAAELLGFDPPAPNESN